MRRRASMEPGHEDREYAAWMAVPRSIGPASMEPGHEDREYELTSSAAVVRLPGLNGARS